MTKFFKSLLEMRRLGDCMAPISWLFLTLFSYSAVYILLNPSLKEFFVLIVVDLFLAYKINERFEGKIFTRFYPESSLYFYGPKEDLIQKLSFIEKIKLLDSLFRFPLRRCFFFCFWGQVKVIPAILIIVFYWNHDLSNWAQFGITYSIISVNFAFLFGAVFFYSHIFVSKMVQEIHHKFNWGEVFEKAEIPPSFTAITVQGVIALLCLFLFVLILQWSVIVFSPSQVPGEIAFKALGIGLLGLFLFAHNWYLSNHIFLQELRKFMLALNYMNFSQEHKILPLHSIPLLAQFQKTFNILAKKLRISELELTSLICHEAERQRYQTLGEISGLIAHDLSGPLHVAQFCVHELQEDPKLFENPLYMEKLDISLQRAKELVESLRSKLKNPVSDDQVANLKSAHEKVMLLLKIQYFSQNFHLIQFDVDPHLKDYNLKMAPVDLIHILDNIYKNCIQHLLEHSIPSPKLTFRVTSHPDDQNMVQLIISDNGLGLSLKSFEELTAYHYIHTYESQGRNKGLGLRLTRRLIELHLGQMTILEGPESQGTHFLIVLPAFRPEFHQERNINQTVTVEGSPYVHQQIQHP